MKSLYQTMLGYRATDWRGLPFMYAGNGRTSIVHSANWGGGVLSNLYTVKWKMDAYLIDWSWAWGYKLFLDPTDGSHIGDLAYAINGERFGYLEDTNIIYVRDDDCGVADVDVEVHYFAPMQAAYLDSFLAVVVIKNNTAVNKTLYLGLANPNNYMNSYLGFSVSRNAVTSKNASEKTWICGSSDAIDAAYIEGAWRTEDYVASNPGAAPGYYERWKFTINAGQTKVWTVLNCFGSSEADALTVYNAMKALNGHTVLGDNVRYWKEWLNEGAQKRVGIYEVDEMTNLILCVAKASLDPDYYSMGAGITAYSEADWPPDTALVFMGFAFFGHTEEAKNYFGTRIKNIVDWIVANGRQLRNIHITSMYGYTAGSGYTGNEFFLLPIFAARTYQLCKDSLLAANVWTWIKRFMDEMDAHLVSSGDFEGCFDWNWLNTSFTYEDWWIGGPIVPYGTACVTSAGIALAAASYRAGAVIAEAVGENSLAAVYRDKARTMREKLRSLMFNETARQYWSIWSDAYGFTMDAEENDWNTVHGGMAVADYVDQRIKESLRLYHYNLINMSKDPNLEDNYYPTLAKTNWMLGKTEPALLGGTERIIDSWFWGVVYSCAKFGLDDLFEFWLKRITEEYGKPRSFMFDEWSMWNGTENSDYTMRRTMGMYLMTLGEYFLRSEPHVQTLFERALERFGSSVTLYKPKQGSTDSYGTPVSTYETTFGTKSLITNLKANERVVAAGLFTVEDIRAEFRALTPVSQMDRLRHGNVLYQVQTVQKHFFEDRLYRVECLCKRVTE